ncbi:MAG: hypothetical protein IIB28_03160 [Chloroflexi bacterium]|nr:hypothetical protein [Chloroflexota bacterium]
MFRRLVVLSMMGIVAVAIAACGSDSPSTPAGAAASAEDDSVGSVIVRTGDTFDVDSFVAAGFKKSKEFSTETVPDASSIWYGFYSQRDVEIRFYGSHEDALGPGADSARAAIDRSPNSNIGGGIITSTGNRTQYHDYLIAGNAVVLCQTEITACQELAGQLP